MGLLNDRLIVPHGVFLDVNPRVHGEDRGDLARLVDAGVSIVHCPLTNARYGSELETFQRYRDAGVNIALGTDSFPPDLIRGIDTGVSVAKVQTAVSLPVTSPDTSMRRRSAGRRRSIARTSARSPSVPRPI